MDVFLSIVIGFDKFQSGFFSVKAIQTIFIGKVCFFQSNFFYLCIIKELSQ